jgi:DNA repair protein RadD
MTLRPYQAEAVESSIDWMRKSVEPFLIDAATGAGKSHIIAEVARRIHDKTGKRVLCLAPSAELVTQNRAKYLATGNPCSTFSASAGGKDLRHPVVFGSPLTVKNRISRFQKQGEQGYALVVVDECHGITPTVRGIIDAMKNANPNLRVMGLTATPYRLGSGYIFREWPDGRINTEDTTRAPFFHKCVYRVDARDLIRQGYLTPPVIGATGAVSYDTGGLIANAQGKFDAEAVDRAYHGHGRLTASIVADVVAQSRDREGVMFFAATVQHAEEVMASLPAGLAAMVTGKTPKGERARILADFLARKIKYLVNVAVLTTGFDAPHVDVIAMLRKTESVGLLQQIVGRGLRLSPGKADCLVLDYTTNLDDHCPDGDLFAPLVKAGALAGEGATITACCEWCGYENEVKLRPEAEGFEIDENGYCLDSDGYRVKTGHGPMPAHFARRCWGYVPIAGGKVERCGYRWTGKDCPTCGESNDIAARYCASCKAEIVDPNEKLVGEFRAMKKDPTQRQTDRVVSVVAQHGVSRSGNKTLRVDFVTPYRSFSIWLMPETTNSRAMSDWSMWQAATQGGEDPKTITYQKDAGSGFYRVFAYNRPEDRESEVYLAAE